MMIDSYDYFTRCESCVYFKSYCYDEYDADVWCEIFDELRYEDCEKYEKRLKDKNNCVFNKDAKSPCKDYDECSKRQGTNKPLPCVVNWMMGRPFENMKKEANR